MNPLLEILGLAGNALGAAGTVLDTPGSIARGLMAGKPGRALSGIFSPDERVGGREMLEDWGALDPNEEGFDMGDVAGFGAEAILDPLALIAPALGARKAFRGMRQAGDVAPVLADVSAMDAPLPGEMSKYDMMSDDELMAGIGDFGEPMRPASEMDLLDNEEFLGQMDPMQQALTTSMEDRFLPLETPGSLMGTRAAESPPVRIKDIFQDLWSDDAGHVGLPIPKDKPLAPTFYSRLEEAAKSLPDKPIPTQSLMNMLRKYPEGLSKEEMQWRKMDDFIKSQGPTTTKSELLSHLQRNEIRLGEVNRSDAHQWKRNEKYSGEAWEAGPEGNKIKIIQDGEVALPNEFVAIDKKTGEIYAGGTTAEEARQKAGFWFSMRGPAGMDEAEFLAGLDIKPYTVPEYQVYDARTNHIGRGTNLAELQAKFAPQNYDEPTKYSSYQSPGGTDYREKTMTLGLSANQYKSAMKNLERELDAGRITSQEYLDRAGALDKQTRMGGYQSSHWPESGVLAHTRYKDNIDPVTGQEYLKIDEVQSDWHQAGQKHGYRTPDLPKQIDAAIAKAEAIKAEMNALEMKAYEGALALEEKARQADLKEAYVDALNEVGDLQSSNRVQDAPFKGDWHQLALKKLIREAAEQGKSGLEWNTGEIVKDYTYGDLPGQTRFYGTGMDPNEYSDQIFRAVDRTTDRTKGQQDYYKAMMLKDDLNSPVDDFLADLDMAPSGISHEEGNRLLSQLDATQPRALDLMRDMALRNERYHQTHGGEQINDMRDMLSMVIRGEDIPGVHPQQAGDLAAYIRHVDPSYFNPAPGQGSLPDKSDLIAELMGMNKPGDEQSVRNFLPEAFANQIGPLHPADVAVNRYPAKLYESAELPNFLEKYVGAPVQPVQKITGNFSASAMRQKFPEIAKEIDKFLFNRTDGQSWGSIAMASFEGNPIPGVSPETARRWTRAINETRGRGKPTGFRIDFPQEFIEKVLYKGQPIMNLAPGMAGGGALLAALMGEQQSG